jgi:ClpP class serine protease
MMASAAYWLGSSANGGVWATRSADVGSIGVYQIHLDYSALVAAAGINAELFKTGEFKAMGHPYFALTEKQRTQLQLEVDTIFGEFVESVRLHRGGVEDDVMQGQTFSGDAAIDAGLVDALVRDRREMLEMIREDIGEGSDYSISAKQRSAPVATTQAEVASAAQPLFLTVNVEGQQPKKKAVTFQRDASGAVIGMKAEEAE